jgi:hypothetical protein
MKKSIFLMLSFFLGIMYSFSQSSTVSIFNQDGVKFWVIVDGEKQNVEPQTKVVIGNLTAQNYKFKILFQDSQIPPIEKNIFTKDVDNKFHNSTYIVRKDNKGNYVAKLNSDEIVTTNIVSDNSNVSYNDNLPHQVPDQNTQVYNQTTTTTTTTVGDPQNIQLGVGINVNETPNGVNMNMNVGGTGINTSGTVTSSYTTTTTTTTSSSNINQEPPADIHHEHNQPPHHYVMSGYSGPTGCPMPISNENFIAVKNSISSKSFEDSKLTIAKQVISNNCLICSQVKEIMLLFSFEATRLELAKFAYKHTFDIGNYYQLNDAFTFETSIEELNQYISNGGN